MNLKDKKGSISIFVLVGLLFMTSFLIISYANISNKSKILKEQFEIISKIYSNGDDINSYTEAYTELRKRNRQTMTAAVDNSNTVELTKTFSEKLSNYILRGNSYQRIINCKNLFNAKEIELDDVQISDDGSTITMPIVTSGNGYTNTGKTLAQVCPKLKIGDVVKVLGFTNDATTRIGYIDGVGVLRNNSTFTVTETFLSTPLCLYANSANTGETQQNVIRNLQFRIDEGTEFEPYCEDTPSPNRPSEIQSVGEKSKNLFGSEYAGNYIVDNINYSAIASLKIIDNRKCLKIIDYYTYEQLKLPITYKENMQYTISMWKKDTEITSAIAYFKAVYTDGTYSYLCNQNCTEWTYVTSTTNPGKTVKYIVGWGTNNGFYTYIDLNTLQIEEGNTATYYVPYNSIIIKSTGKNLLDKSQSGWNGIKDESEISCWGSAVFSNKWVIDNLEPDTQYTISYKVTAISLPEHTSEYSNNLGFLLYSGVAGYENLVLYKSKYIQDGEVINVTKTFTTPSNLHDIAANYKILGYTNRYLNNGVGVYSNVIFSNIQIEKGSLATEYKEYEENVYTIDLSGHEPLRKVGDVSDYIDYANKKIVRNVIKATVNGSPSENWVLTDKTQTNTFRFYIRGYDIAGYGTQGNSNITAIISDKFVTSTTIDIESVNNSSQIQSAYSGLANIVINKTRIGYNNGDDDATIISKFKEWLQSNNVTFYYPINEFATPIEEPIDLPEISTFEDYTKIEVLSNIAPSRIELAYEGYKFD